MHRVVHFKCADEAKLIQRMFVWQGFGCSMKEDSSVLQETRGRPAALLYRHRTLVAKGFFQSVDYLLENGLIHCNDDPGVRPKRTPPKPKPKPEVAPVLKAECPVDPFDIPDTGDHNF